MSGCGVRGCVVSGFVGLFDYVKYTTRKQHTLSQDKESSREWSRRVEQPSFLWVRTLAERRSKSTDATPFELQSGIRTLARLVAA